MQSGDSFWQEIGQLDCEAEVLETVPVPVLFQRLTARHQRPPQLGQERAGEFGEVEVGIDDHRGSFEGDQGPGEEHELAREGNAMSSPEREPVEQETGNRELRRRLAEPLTATLATARQWARLTVVAQPDEVVVSVVTPSTGPDPAGPAATGTDNGEVEYVYERDGDQVWAQTRWRAT